MKRSFYKNPAFWICTAGLAALSTLFVRWWIHNTYAPHARLSALICTILFAAVCLRFVPEWMRFWRKPAAPRRPILAETPRHMDLKIFVALLVMNLGILLAVFLIRRTMGYQETFSESLKFWRCLDSNSYLQIAKDWYAVEGDRRVQLVFLPGYPIAVRLMMLFVGSELYAGFAVSILCFSGAGCLFYRLMRLDHPHEFAMRALKYLCILPGTFFYAAPMTESMFLLLCVGCIYLARTGKWTLGCLLGGIAAFTRSLGATLLAPLVIEMIAHLRSAPHVRRQAIRKTLSLLLIPAGLAAYFWVNYAVSGNPFMFQSYQSSHWNQHLGWFFNTAAYQLDQALQAFSERPQVAIGLWCANLFSIFSSLTLMMLAAKRLRPSYTAWYIGYFFIAIGATWLLSAPRYLLTCFPIAVALAHLTRKPENDRLTSISLIPLNLIYLYAFVARWQVW